MTEYVRLSVGLVVLPVIAVAVSYFAGVRRERDLVTASVRAVLQLALVAAALRGVFAAPWLSALVVAMMFTVATSTAARRLQMMPGSGRAVVYACGAGATVANAVIVALPTLDRNVRTFVAVSDIVLGGTMTAATLVGPHLDEGLRRRREEVEAWLSVGASRRVRPFATSRVVPPQRLSYQPWTKPAQWDW
jgi:putative ABC transport system permease protein